MHTVLTCYKHDEHSETSSVNCTIVRNGVSGYSRSNIMTIVSVSSCFVGVLKD